MLSLRPRLAKLRCWVSSIPRQTRRRILLVSAPTAAVVVIALVALTTFQGGGSVYSTAFGSPQHTDGSRYSYGRPISFGTVNPPPKAVKAKNKGIDVIAHWYNDFGLASTALSKTQAAGWWGWYDWRWNDPANTGDGKTAQGYDPARQPLLGDYRGDDPGVLGWIAYWLAKAGVNTLSIAQSSGFSSKGWADPKSSSHWLYVLLTQVPNSKAFDYVLWLKSSGTKAQLESQSADLVSAYKTFKNGYSYVEGGKRYAMVSIWDMEALRGSLDRYQGSVKTEAFLGGLAAKFKALGYAGVGVLARNAGVVGTRAVRLAAAGVKIYPSSYDGKYATPKKSTDYRGYVATAQLPKAPGTVLGAFSSLNSVRPHPSHYAFPGSSPALFHDLLGRTARQIVRHGLPRMMTIYNVSEWAEGGPGLVPNVRDGFGYLEALRTLPTYPAPPKR